MSTRPCRNTKPSSKPLPAPCWLPTTSRPCWWIGRGDPRSLERALALSRDFERQAPNPYFLDTLGWVHLKLGHQEEAIRVMQLAVEKAPEHPVLNYHLGAAFVRAGRAKEARNYLQKALSASETFSGADEARTLLAGLNG